MEEQLSGPPHPEARRRAASTPVLFAAIASVVNANMAARFDKLEKTRDRLERIFSKRGRKSSSIDERVSPVNHHQHHHHRLPLTPPATSQLDSDPLIFPSPSFLRPTASRMQARDEVKVIVGSPRRAKSLPENSPSYDRMPSIDESLSASVSSFFSVAPCPKVPKRSSSLLQRRRDPSIASLLEFSFSEKRACTTSNTSTRSSDTDPISPRRKVDPNQSRELTRLPGPLPVFSARQPDTPPDSDSSDCASPSLAPSHCDRHLPPPPSAVGVFTPEPSPVRRPRTIQSPTFRRTDSCVPSAMTAHKHRSLEMPAVFSTGTVSLRKTVSDSTLVKTVPTLKDDFVLEEPTVETFLSLSDDDIADGPPVTPPPGQFGPARLGSGRAPTFDLPPDPPVFPVSSPRSGSRRYSPLIYLSSPLTSRPAKVAAFECQRIAHRFHFDLIYIVNLWPENIGHASSSCSSIPCPDVSLGSPHRARSRTPCLGPYRRPTLTGRLLAGHGLANLQTPFMISSEAHTKILRRDGWVEWRDEFPSQDHFSRGYSRAFYAGVSPECAVAAAATTTRSPGRPTDPYDKSNNGSVITLSEKRRNQPLKNRGIVFAAYRFPEPDGTTRRTDAAQLEALHREAETLVEMLLDIHKTERSRGASDCRRVVGPGAAAGADETGPLPVRPKYSPSLV